MKKLIMILMTAGAMTAMSCGDGRTNESANDTDTGGDNTELAEPADTTSMESDTTSTQDMNQQQRDDQNMQRGASENSDTESRNQRDTIQ
ncbi:MAG TPA: hypothetical protein VGD65_14370 [Chryseosolibacter sp.]